MYTVHKYPFSLSASFTLMMPLDADIVAVDARPDAEPCILARVSTMLPLAPRHFALTRTGEFPPTGAWHIRTFHAPPYVWHLWGRMDSDEDRSYRDKLRFLKHHAQETKP
jgi:hypothetical protein